VPSLSIAVVTGGGLSYAQAYGDASLSPRRSARPDMRYAIGSISKQFTATAVLMLAEQGKLSLDDPVGRYVPSLTRANDVTVRQLLSHTSGYQDYWPQDYVPPFMLQPVTGDRILELWARKPLDFEPGAQWQYSNTGYVIAGLVVEKASGMPLMAFLADRIFKPLGMASVADVDRGRLTDPDPAGYIRFALGPLRPAPKEGAGWLFAAGELAMTASDLARWNLGVIDQKLMKPSSYRAMAAEVLLNNGQATRYGLGVRIITDQGHRGLEHGGEVSGFTAENVIYPDDRAAITVLTNQDAVGAATDLARRITPVIFPVAQDADMPKFLQSVRGVFDGLQKGQIDRSLFTANCNAYFTDQAVQDGSQPRPAGRADRVHAPDVALRTRRHDVPRLPGSLRAANAGHHRPHHAGRAISSSIRSPRRDARSATGVRGAWARHSISTRAPSADRSRPRPTAPASCPEELRIDHVRCRGHSAMSAIMTGLDDLIHRRARFGEHGFDVLERLRRFGLDAAGDELGAVHHPGADLAREEQEVSRAHGR
jgi:CubicO group peptidase (beta-lactamase class C family)